MLVPTYDVDKVRNFHITSGEHEGVVFYVDGVKEEDNVVYAHIMIDFELTTGSFLSVLDDNTAYFNRLYMTISNIVNQFLLDAAQKVIDEHETSMD
jgi:hypothetical protein